MDPQNDPLEILSVGAATPSPPSPGESGELNSSCLSTPDSRSLGELRKRDLPEGVYKEIEDFGDDFLEICVTFTNENRLNFKEPTLKSLVRNALYDVLQHTKCNPQWLIYSEYSKVGNFHYHGMLKGFNGAALAKLKRILNHTCGFTRISMVKSTEGYKSYIVKDYKLNARDFDLKRIEK